MEAKSIKRAAKRKAKREQPAVYHRRGEPLLLSLDSGQHSGEDWCQPCPAPEPELSQHRCRDVSSGIQEDSQGARQRLGRHREGGLRNQQRCRHRS